MKELKVKLRNEQEKRVLLAFLNCLDYQYDLPATTEHTEENKNNSAPSDTENGGQPILTHYATE